MPRQCLSDWLTIQEDRPDGQPRGAVVEGAARFESKPGSTK